MGRIKSQDPPYSKNLIQILRGDSQILSADKADQITKYCRFSKNA